jgi:hypothetical protein
VRAKQGEDSREALEAEWKARRELLDGLYDRYAGGMEPLDTSRLRGCLAGRPGRQHVFNSLNAVFHERSFLRIRKMAAAHPDTELAGFIQAVDSGFARGSLQPLVTATGGLGLDPAQNAQAGVHRSSSGVFIDYTQIRPQELLAITVHEMVHRLDLMLLGVNSFYSDPQRYERMSRLGRKPLEQLTSRERESLNDWVESGLYRGLLAEYRAWDLTARVYLTLRELDPKTRMPWLDGLIGGRAPGPELSKHLFAVLDADWKDPTTGPFEGPALREIVARLRAKHRADPMISRARNFYMLMSSRQ